jgi:hypothetical protein
MSNIGGDVWKTILMNYTMTDLDFGIDDAASILQQLETSNRLSLPRGLRGYPMVVQFKARHLIRDGHYYMWLSNDERKRLIRTLKQK